MGKIKNYVCQAAAQGSSAEAEPASWSNGQVQFSQCAYIPTKYNPAHPVAWPDWNLSETEDDKTKEQIYYKKKVIINFCVQWWDSFEFSNNTLRKEVGINQGCYSSLLMLFFGGQDYLILCGLSKE